MSAGKLDGKRHSQTSKRDAMVWADPLKMQNLEPIFKSRRIKGNYFN